MNYSNLASGVIGAILVIMVQHLIPYICYLWKKCKVVRVLRQNKPNINIQECLIQKLNLNSI